MLDYYAWRDGRLKHYWPTMADLVWSALGY